jgi:pyruvate-formate lyase-activating enzyme
MEEEIKLIKTEADKKKELDEKLKKIAEEKSKDEAVLANLKSEVLLKDEENKKLLEEKKKLAEENAKKEAFLKEQQKKGKGGC